MGTTLLFPGDGEPPATLTQLSINGSLVFSASTAPNSYQIKGILTHVNLKGPHKNQFFIWVWGLHIAKVQNEKSRKEERKENDYVQTCHQGPFTTKSKGRYKCLHLTHIRKRYSHIHIIFVPGVARDPCLQSAILVASFFKLYMDKPPVAGGPHCQRGSCEDHFYLIKLSAAKLVEI